MKEVQSGREEELRLWASDDFLVCTLVSPLFNFYALVGFLQQLHALVGVPLGGQERQGVVPMGLSTVREKLGEEREGHGPVLRVIHFAFKPKFRK